MLKANTDYVVNGIKHRIMKSFYRHIPGFHVSVLVGDVWRPVFRGTLAECRNYLKDYQNRCTATIDLPDHVPGMAVEPMQLPEVTIPEDFNI